MKSFFNILDLNIELYKMLGLSQAIPDQERLGNKSHRSLIKHQEAYSKVQDSLGKHVNSPVLEPISIYLENVNYFLKTLNSNFWNTPKSESECNDIYWQYLLAPLAATFLDACRKGEHQDSTVYYLWKLIQTWTPGMEAKDMKVWIKQSIKNEGGLMKAWVQQSIVIENVRLKAEGKQPIKIKGKLKTPEFTKKVNDIRESTHSPETINKNINYLDRDLTIQGIPDDIKQKATSQMRGVYQATMIFHRVHSTGSEQRLNQIKQYNDELTSYGDTPISADDNELLVFHQELLNCMLKTNICWSDHYLTIGFNEFLDEKLTRKKPLSSIKLINSGTNAVWPEQEALVKALSDIKECHNQTNLDSIILQYYKMYSLAGNNQHKEAFELCTSILEEATNVHLGEIRASLLIHKIVLGYEVGGMTKHNQLNGLLTDAAFTLPDKGQLAPELIELLDSNEGMRSQAYNLYNIGHPKAKISPLKKLELFCERVLEIVNKNPNEEAKELLPELRKVLGNEVTADTQL